MSSAGAGRGFQELDARARRRLARDLLLAGRCDRVVVVSGDDASGDALMPWVGNGFNAGRGVGGSTMHHYAVWPRLHENDFRVKSLYGRSRDWPIAYADLQPYYDRVQEECGISGNHLAETTRPPGSPYPMPPVPVSVQGRVVAQGGGRYRLQLHDPTPSRRTYAARDLEETRFVSGNCPPGFTPLPPLALAGL